MIQETKFHGEGSGGRGGEGSQEIEGIAMRVVREDEGSIVGEGSISRKNAGEGSTRTRTSEGTGLWNDLQTTDFPISQGKIIIPYKFTPSIDAILLIVDKVLQ